MIHGFDQQLYILPFDHRGSFETGLFGWKGTLTSEQTARIADAKQVIYNGFKAAVKPRLTRSHGGFASFSTSLNPVVATRRLLSPTRSRLSANSH